MSEVNWDDVLSAAAVLRDAAADIDHSLGSGSPGDATLSEVVRVMMVANEVEEIVAHMRGALHDIADALMEDNEQTVPDIARLIRNWSRKRSDWQSEQLRGDALRALKASVPAHAVDPETGEAVHTWDQAIAAVSRVYNLAGYNARVTALRDIGLDVGEYSTQGPWQPKITIEPLEPDDAVEE